MTMTVSDAARRIGPGYLRPGPRRPKRRKGGWSGRGMAASLTFSAFWHVLVVAVLALAVHPFELPDHERAIDVALLPPLIVPQPEEPPLRLRPAPPEEAQPQPARPDRARPLPQLLQKTPEVRQETPAQTRPLDTRRPTAFDLQRPEAAVEQPPAPPAPVEVARPAPSVLPRPVEVERRPAPSAPRTLDSSRPAPTIAPPVAAAAEPAPAAAAAPEPAAPSAPADIPVLTNQQVIQAPIEIRPRERPAASGPRTTAPALPEIPVPPAGTAGGAGAPPAAGGILKPYGPINGGFQDAQRRGLRMRLGCASPDTYKLTAEEKAECLRRLAQEGQAAADLGLNIPAAKQAEYDRFTACRNRVRGATIPSSGADSTGASVRGLGDNPTLRECGPGMR